MLFVQTDLQHRIWRIEGKAFTVRKAKLDLIRASRLTAEQHHMLWLQLQFRNNYQADYDH